MKKTPTVPRLVVLLAGIATGCGESPLNGQSETVMRDGGLWVGRTVRLPSATNTAYDVFRADGTYLGEMRFPARFDLHEVGEDYVLGVRLDELDVPYVELYALGRR